MMPAPRANVKLFLRHALSACILGYVAIPYAEVLAQNVRAARARKGLDQEPVAARMRALGFPAWRRQTVAGVEKNTRRVTAEEVFGLAVALETSFMSLVEPVREDGPVGLPSGAELPFLAAHCLFWGGSELSVTWDDDTPRFPAEDPAPGYAVDYENPLPPPRLRRGRPAGDQ